MLFRLSIRDIVLIERLDIDFSNGLTVLTGETGAGKSILLDALSLALGARGDGSLVRSGADSGQVTAAFDLNGGHAVAGLLEANDIPEEGALILRRTQGSDGRTRAFVNDQPVSVGLMREIGQRLVEIHGQHDDRALVDRQMHRFLLDAFGGLAKERARTGEAWQQLQKMRRELEQHRKRVADSAREADFLRASVAELAILAPEPGEEGDLAEARGRMMKAQAIATDLNEAHEQIAGSGSPIPELSSLVRRLERKSGDGREMVAGVIEALDAAVGNLHVAQDELERAMREADFDPAELDRTEERLFALRAASRKFSVPVEELTSLAVRLADELATLDAGEARLDELERQVAALEAEYKGFAEALSAQRKTAADQLCATVQAELPALKLENAAFMVNIASGPELSGGTGQDDVEFWVRTNPGSRPGPILKIASGGELSRFLLALKVALADRGSAPTLIFDEIDAGAGGAVADAIGRRLARLAERVQVLSVTHAPQVAARADRHFLISKQAGEAVLAATTVGAIEGESRREEIARMLAGATVTDEARAAAEKLINQPAA